jgi:tRNA A37 threonylcarbamoyladenosine modification protein TsaB
MVLLIIDTSYEKALVALSRQGRIVAERRWKTGPAAGQEVIAAVQELLAAQALSLTQVDSIAVQAGPARRTSPLRAGVTVANMLALASGKELVAIAGETAVDMAQQALKGVPVGFVTSRY